MDAPYPDLIDAPQTYTTVLQTRVRFEMQTKRTKANMAAASNKRAILVPRARGDSSALAFVCPGLGHVERLAMVIDVPDAHRAGAVVSVA